MALEKIGVEATIEGLSSFRRGIGQMDDDVRGFGRSADGVVPGLNRMGDSLLNIGAVAAGAVVAGLAAATAGVVAFAGSGIKAAVDMEDQMGNIAAVMNTTKEAIQPLADLIVDLGVDPGLKVTAEEAANAIELLARNGLTMQEILDGAARSTVLLANATGADFGNAADIATDAMAIFNIEAKDMNSVVDSMVSVTTNSKFTIEDFSLALRNGGAAAAIMNVSMEDFNTVIAASAEEMGSGMRAGTGFRNFLTRLTPNSEKATEAMRTLGLITADGTNAFFDANGQLKDMAEVSGILQQALFGTSTVMSEVGGRTAEQNRELERLQGIYNRTLISIQDYSTGVKGAGLSEEARANKLEDLQLQLANVQAQMGPLQAIQGDFIESTKTLTDAERSAFLEMIFGQDALGTAIALANEGEEGFAALAESMSETDAAAAALERMDSVAGVFEILGGVIDTVKLQIGQAFLPLVRDLADQFLVIANNIGPQIVNVFTNIASGVGGFISILQAGGTPVNAFFGALASAGVPNETINQIRSIVLSVQEFIGTIVEFVSTHSEAFKGAIIGIGAVLGSSVIISIITGIVAAIGTLLSPIGLVVAAVVGLSAAWNANWGGIQEKTAAAMEFIRNIITTVSTGIQEFWAAYGQQILAVANMIWTAITTKIQTDIETIRSIIVTVSTAIQAFWDAHGQTILATARIIWEAIKATINTVIEAIRSIILAFKSATEGDWRSFGENLRDAWDTVWEFIKNAVSSAIPLIIEGIQNLISSVRSTITNVDWGAVGLAIIQGIANGIRNGAGAIADAAVAAAQAALDAAKGFLGIESPSKLAMQVIGTPFTEGIAEGINQPKIVEASINHLFSQALMPQSIAAQPSVVNPSSSVTNIQRTAQVQFGDVSVGDNMDMQMLGDFIVQKVAEAL